MSDAPAGCLICSAGAGGCTGHPITTADAVRPLTLPLPTPHTLESPMPRRRELRTLPGGATYYVNVSDPTAPRGKARAAPEPAAPAVLLIGESPQAVEEAAEAVVADEVPVAVIADGPAKVTPPPAARRRKG